MKNFLELAQTPSVLDVQRRKGSLGRYDTSPPGFDTLDPEEAAFVTAADSFYMATVTEDGWPYVQHKGGDAGFVQQLGPASIGWSERPGNRQYLGAGNVEADGRVALIFVDYPRRLRLKVLGRATHFDEVPADLTERLAPDGRRSDGAYVIDVEATAWNCPKYITPRVSVAEVETVVTGLQQRIADLEAEVERLSRRA